MKLTSLIKAAAGGLVVSFVGSLPPGHMTIAATFITTKQGEAAGWIYSFGSVIAELIVIWAILTAMALLSKWRRVFFILEIITAVILLVMSVACFYSVKHTGAVTAITGEHNFYPFTTGFLLSILNPVHIPFWMGWTVVLMNKNIVQQQPRQYISYLIGISIGSLIGFAVYIYGGAAVLNAFNKNQTLIELLAGVVLLVIFAMQVKKIVFASPNMRYANLFKQNI